MADAPRAGASSAAPGLLASDPLQLAARLALLALVLDPGLRWWERIPVLVLAGLGWLSPALATRALLWLLIAAALAAALIANWPLSDNHAYLWAFTSLALAGAAVAVHPTAALARQARLLIGITFFFATLWKGVLSPDFVDGSFFRVTLLTDSRFEEVARLLGGVDTAGFEAFERARELSAQGVAWAQAGFAEPPALRRVAAALTFFTLAIEGALAVAFLWPGSGPRRQTVRDLLLLGFCLTTFVVARVAGFGRLLVVLGVAQCPPEGRRTRIAYVAAFFWILAMRSVPALDWVLAWRGAE